MKVLGRPYFALSLFSVRWLTTSINWFRNEIGGSWLGLVKPTYLCFGAPDYASDPALDGVGLWSNC